MDQPTSTSASTAASASPNIEQLLSRWPVASTLSHHLPVGDLIVVSRLSMTLRALLHGFELPPTTAETPNSVRPELHIGHHGTVYWQRLKDRAPFECSSRTHTKGPAPKPCRYCSRPICDACIVRDSLFKGHENTFPNRVRYLCKQCWESGNDSQTCRYPLDVTPGSDHSSGSPPSSSSSSSSLNRKQWYDPSGSTRDYCTCTLKTDGILCLECKDAQNRSAVSSSTSTPSSETRCHGQSCTNTLTAEDIDRRRICLWCNKALPRQLGGTTRHHWTQKIIEARARHAASRSADVEEWNRKRLRERTMSRREMRGDDAVRDDPDADVPQLVRHLDTVNYQNYMAPSAAPSPDAVFASKTGYWRYSRDFMLAMRSRCAKAAPTPRGVSLRAETAGKDMPFAQTNAEKAADRLTLAAAMRKMPRDRLSEWCAYRAVIMDCLLEQNLSHEATREFMQREHNFEASIEDYGEVMHVWTTQERRRKSLECEIGTTTKGRGKGAALEHESDTTTKGSGKGKGKGKGKEKAAASLKGDDPVPSFKPGKAPGATASSGKDGLGLHDNRAQHIDIDIDSDNDSSDDPSARTNPPQCLRRRPSGEGDSGARMYQSRRRRPPPQRRGDGADVPVVRGIVVVVVVVVVIATDCNATDRIDINTITIYQKPGSNTIRVSWRPNNKGSHA
ncbi:hypothetical protein G647_06516 [Cladophialophora carrionii CBS 160.54]|uniref:Clr5 domain-containing protein n=1 Tax=Cladophialophora carrionii CBS 160.54 TaxID=1279043 RepID=V9D732_9EURO|nr:uncharacterized protein G647_06516 [Cladophialophora carrionii CBS 160.54]ETI22441.1 hypothetical protein G647_06516 [Cladophialophora carrionii CBS 160.54]